MKNFCAIADDGFLLKAMTLYHSLELNESTPFTFHFLCLTDSVYEFLIKNEFKNIRPLKISELMEADFDLWNARYSTPSAEAIDNAAARGKDPKYIQFCWALSSYLCYFLSVIEDRDWVIYADSDLFFYRDTDVVINEMGDYSAGIIRHRINYPAEVIKTAGEYNVGIVVFRNDEYGKRCVTWWKEMLLDPNNPYFSEYGGCGDQKYLELFIPLFGDKKIQVLDHDVGHLAPWNTSFHKYSDNGKIIWQGREQDLCFFHFAHFVPDFETDTYKSAYGNEWVWGVPEEFHPCVKTLYDDYYNISKEVRKNLNLD